MLHNVARGMSFISKVLVTVVAAFTGAVLARNANADSNDEGSWHQQHRVAESPQQFALEFRGTMYRPAIDDAFPAGSKPYEAVFGNDRRFCIGLEFDWQAFRIPWVGTIGPGFGWSYTAMSALAKTQQFPAVTGAPLIDSAESTSLKIMPMYVAAVLRVDVLARETPIPLVPYGKLGLGYGLFWTGRDAGDTRTGHTWGKHYAIGGMLQLDWLDRQASMQLDNEMGINNTYLFAEWMVADLDGFADSSDRSHLRIGTSSWVFGLAFEM